MLLVVSNSQLENQALLKVVCVQIPRLGLKVSFGQVNLG